MPFIPAVNTAQVKVIQRLHDQMVTNTMYFTKNSPWDAISLTDLANKVIVWWNDELAGVLSNGTSLQAVQARSMQAEDAPGVEIGPPAGSGGDVVNPAMPGNVALAVKFLTGLTGRNRRGRNFIAGLPENAQEGNQVTAAIRDLIVGMYEALNTTMSASGYSHAVASFYDGTVLALQQNGETRRVPVPRATALLTPVLTYGADLDLDSQRRRLTGRGS